MKHNPVKIISPCIAAAVLLSGLSVKAATGNDTWTGAGADNNWNTAGNWSTGSANQPPVTGDALFFDGTTQLTANNNNTAGTSFNGINFNSTAGAFSLAGNQVTTSAAINDNSLNPETISLALAFSSTHSIYTLSGGSLIIGGVISGTGDGITKTGGGTVTLNGSAVNTYTGATTVNAGTLVEDFSNLGSTANLINSGSALALGGGILQMKGNASTASSQTFASTAINAGSTTITAAPASGSNYPTLALGAFTASTGASINFIGPATIGANNVAVAATSAITTTTTGSNSAGAFGLLIKGNQNNPYATVGLYDWASTDLAAGTAGTSPYAILGGSQVTGFYFALANNANTAAESNLDFSVQQTPAFGGTSNIRFSSGTQTANTFRFNSGHAPYVTVKSGTFIEAGGVLVTPNMGTINCGIDILRLSSQSCQLVQNNTAGVFCLGLTGGATDGPFFANDSNTGDAVIISGQGAVFLNPGSPMHIPFNYLNASSAVTTSTSTYYDSTQTNSSIWGAFYINGGVTVINNANVLGTPTTQSAAAGGGGTVNLNGGTLMAATTTANGGSVTLTNAAASANRTVFIGNNGGGLAAQSGTIFTVGGAISNAPGTGSLTIGIPASTANGNVAGLVPGTGGSTLNPAFNATGTVALTGTNTYTGGTVVQTGTLNINGINALGGTSYGGLTLNGGTLQYATSFSGNGSGDLTPVGMAGVTLASGGGTIDVNGNAVTYAGSIGNSGSGALTVKSTVANGSLTLSAASTYTGITTVSSGTLMVNNPTGSGTGSGAVIVNSGAILGGSGTISGTVTNNGVIVPGNVGVGTLTVGSLPMNSGSTYDFEFNATPANDQIVVTTAGGLTVNGGVFNFYQAGSTTGWVPASSATYNLIQFSGTAPALDTTWTTDDADNPHVANPQSGYTYHFGINNSYLTVTITQAATIGLWNVDNSGNWSTAGNWSGSVPGANTGSAGDTATFAGVTTTAPRTVTLDANESVGAITMNQAQSFTIANGGLGNVLTLDNKNAGATLTASAGTANAIQTAVSLTDNAIATVSSGQSLAISGTISNSTGVTKTLTVNGAGTLALSGNNTYGPATAGTVGTTLSGTGTLQLDNNNALGAGDLSVSASGTLQAGTSVSLANNLALGSGITATLDSDGNSLTLGGTVSGSGGVTKIGAGTLTLNSANSYANNTAITAGTLKLGVANAIPNGGSTTGWLILDGNASAAGTLDLNGFNQTVNALSGLTGAVLGQIVNNSGSGTSTLTVNSGTTTSFAGLIEDNNNSTAGKVGLSKSGTGTLTLSGASTYSSGTTLSAGQLNINNGGSGSGNSAIGTGSLAIAGGTIDNTSGGSVTLQPAIAEAWNGDFTFIGSSALNLASGTVTLGASRTLTVNASTLTVGAIGDNGSNYSLTKAGSGTLVLDAAGTYGGGTTQSAGVILVSNSFALGYGPFAHAVGSIQLGNGVNVTNSFNNATSDTSDAMIDCPSGAATWSGPVNSSGSGGLRIANDGGTLTLTGTGSNRGIIFEYGTLVFAGSANFVNANGSGNIWDIGRDPAGSGRIASLTLENSAAFSTSNTGMGFGGGKVTGACTLTIQDNASLNLGTGSFDLHTASSGTSANTINLNGGTLTLGAFIKSDTTYTATMNLNGGVITAGAAGAMLPVLPVLTVNVGTNGAKINDNGLAISIAQPLLGMVSDAGLTKSGAGTLTLTGTNTYNGATTISSGALALIGSGSISNSAGIVLTNDAKFDVTGLSATFALGAGQILTNIMGTGLIAGNLNLNSGSLALNYSNGVPALAVTNGTLNFNSNAVTVTVSGASLAVGTYTLIATNTAGLVAGTLPASVTVNGSGAAAAASLQIVNGELNLVIAANHPPVAAPMTVYRTAGLNLKIALSDLATNWSDPDGDTVTLAGINLLTTNGVNLVTNSTWITYTNGSNMNDQFSYTISDGQATATGVVNIVVNSTATGNNSIAAITQGNPTTIKAYGIPGYTYITQRTTSMSSPDWVNISTNTAAANGVISVTDNFSDLGGNAPPSAYYRLSWNP